MEQGFPIPILIQGLMMMMREGMIQGSMAVEEGYARACWIRRRRELV
jgi:hypothetical protein